MSFSSPSFHPSLMPHFFSSVLQMGISRLLFTALLIPFVLGTIIMEDYDSNEYPNSEKSPVSSIEYGIGSRIVIKSTISFKGEADCSFNKSLYCGDITDGKN
ncbi:hypothetical protein PRIPAC_94687 [Pristionchus pacificus]|uniref:Uncharacterized protein n=1 Tax=Pristionchus pacificus TaxID=54126 RepID=A0A2A6BA70_PRIPA|nr:hypothetical protein PRIPAC_94687 [Pristionchus pacificus]|eukprot:PDM62779.1 hypothetical protein PRIPAC_49994 [Pristionchus pacificus]